MLRLHNISMMIKPSIYPFSPFLSLLQSSCKLPKLLKYFSVFTLLTTTSSNCSSSGNGSGANQSPEISSLTPASPVLFADPGDSLTFALNDLADPDGDEVTVEWSVNGFARGEESTFAYEVDPRDGEIVTVEAAFSDGSSATVVKWDVYVHPGSLEITFWNGKYLTSRDYLHLDIPSSAGISNTDEIGLILNQAPDPPSGFHAYREVEEDFPSDYVNVRDPGRVHVFAFPPFGFPKGMNDLTIRTSDRFGNVQFQYLNPSTDHVVRLDIRLTNYGPHSDPLESPHSCYSCESLSLDFGDCVEIDLLLTNETDDVLELAPPDMCWQIPNFSIIGEGGIPWYTTEIPGHEIGLYCAQSVPFPIELGVGDLTLYAYLIDRLCLVEEEGPEPPTGYRNVVLEPGRYSVVYLPHPSDYIARQHFYVPPRLEFIIQ